MSLSDRILTPEVAEDWIREILRLGPCGARLTVTGTCMEPSLKEGSKIALEPVRRPVRAGDIVLVRTPAGLRLHRVLACSRGRIRTKGDRGVYLDPEATLDAVIAVCATGESAFTRRIRVGLSLTRLLLRPFRFAARAPDRGDGAHARLLP